MPWQPPAELLAYAATFPVVPFPTPVPWNGGADCSGHAEPGTVELRRRILARFPGIVYAAGTYNCRPNTANTATISSHGEGRGVDAMIRTVAGQADPAGDAVANWLVRYAVPLGVQFIAWDRRKWNREYPGEVRVYTGPNPHTDHVHAERVAGDPPVLDFVEGPLPGQGTGLVVPLLALGAGVALAWWATMGRRR